MHTTTDSKTAQTKAQPTAEQAQVQPRAAEQTAAQAQAQPCTAEQTAAQPQAQPHTTEPTARLLTKEDYDRRYHAKTGDDPTPPHGFTCSYLPERGWCHHRLDNEAKLLFIWSVSGDGRFWRDWARATAALCDCRAIVTICTRPILPYIRLWHWHIDRTETKNGHHRYHCRTADGRPVLITHKHTDPDGQIAYWVTEYLTERNDTHG